MDMRARAGATEPTRPPIDYCQYRSIAGALRGLSPMERLVRIARRKARGLRRRFRAAMLALGGAEVVRRSGDGGGAASGASRPVGSGSRPSRLRRRLGAGDLVTVRSIEEIRRTLNEKNECDGLKFMRPMEAYCGRTYRVMKRVRYIVDDRDHVVRKIRNTVLLEGVMCEGNLYGREGCDRSCFFFWKEAWLRRADDGAEAPSGPARGTSSA